jgi:hypothetical protein
MTFIRGEQSVVFETALQDFRTIQKWEIVPRSLHNNNDALEAVAYTYFPYCALGTQSLWENRMIFKTSAIFILFIQFH